MGWAVGKLESCRTAAGGAGISTSTIPKVLRYLGTLLYSMTSSWGLGDRQNYLATTTAEISTASTSSLI